MIIAEAHNPTVISDYFLLKSNIIDDVEQIKKENSILTPAFSQINLKDGSSITVDPGRMAITAPYGKTAFTQGQNYCKSLPYIKGKAVGINFVVNVTDISAKEWFEAHNIDDMMCTELKYSFSNCKLTIVLVNDTSAQLGYNFHYELNDIGSLGEIKLDFENEWQKDKEILDKDLTKLFQD